MISVNIASIHSRKKQLINTIKSLIDQVDVINICLNNYIECPFEHDKVNYFYSDNVFGDSGKFLFLNDFDGYYFTCDDDLIYPPTYIKDMIRAIDKFGIVSHHGRTFQNFPIQSYYKSPSFRFRCLDKVSTTEPVQICGTGVLGFHTKTIKPSINVFEIPNLSDIWFSLYANSLGFNVWVLAHEKGYIKYQDIPVDETIWGKKNNADKFETDLINDYFLNK